MARGSWQKPGGGVPTHGGSDGPCTAKMKMNELVHVLSLQLGYVYNHALHSTCACTYIQ